MTGSNIQVICHLWYCFQFSHFLSLFSLLQVFLVNSFGLLLQFNTGCSSIALQIIIIEWFTNNTENRILSNFLYRKKLWKQHEELFVIIVELDLNKRNRPNRNMHNHNYRILLISTKAHALKLRSLKSFVTSG